jgi:hypothetical protein
MLISKKPSLLYRYKSNTLIEIVTFVPPNDAVIPEFCEAKYVGSTHFAVINALIFCMMVDPKLNLG